MKTKIFLLLVLSATLGMFVSCDNDSWLERQPKNRINDEQLWGDPELILSLLSNYYDRIPGDVFNTSADCQLDDAMFSGHNDGNWVNDFQFGGDYGRYWDYGFIRDINLAIENLAQYSTLTIEEVQQYDAELRLIRALVYFNMVKNMGGVPLVTEQLIYDGSGDVESLQVPRSKEEEVYDFIYDEIQDIKENFTKTESSNTRGNKYIALALQSRAMLYAASLAKYNNEMSTPITLPGGEVGIPASRATEYYQKSLDASTEIIESGRYSLDEDFYDLFMDKSSSEIIFAKDYSRDAEKLNGFTYDNVVRSLRTDIEGSSMVSPSLGLVESFDYLDGSEGSLKDVDANGDYIIYSSLSAIFANKDKRLEATVVYPGAQFRSKDVDIQAGVAEWNGSGYDLKTGDLGSTTDNGGKLTGLDGPVNDAQFVSNSGFYLRKLVSEDPDAGIRPTLGENWWPWFRLGEIYLNAGEAAFELGQSDAVDYINKVREVHGGFDANSLSSLTIETIQKERRVELAFEGNQRFFDLKRWRTADQVWDGDNSNPDAMVVGLYPYQITNKGSDDGKYIFVRTAPIRFKQPRFFRMANYYASIDQGVLNNNPKLVKNPFQ
ncbi:RagB/SusD family nutrient uptake outer membrane protein [Mangrovibacterium diazotrophicum]|uniref:Putative outer membrane starch-binding protein n=1 Tax=Mangrovibacterium diazotrophicum TaxID=1261403 RepID=A0A419W663_9BACT|nr:RagB/SusD family nutrient uptake outer membrane protein [Mangrovibacterium diazotrophicum]RKD90910.1 putative outer membrane starch-binding protein [Mangrovibacterium diazotrophicum]